MNKLDCINLKKSIRIGVNGHVTHCCLQLRTLKNDNGGLMRSKNNTFDEMLNNKQSNEIRDSFKKGIKHPMCKLCWDEEKNGLKSKRLRDSRHYKGMGINYVGNEVVFLDLSLSNTCNLKCRTCNPVSSSLWKKEYHEIPDSILPNKLINYQKDIDEAYVKDGLFWDECKKHISTIRWIDFYGGEPFLVEDLWDFLKAIVKEGRAKDINLHYNTNGTIWNNEKYEILKEFKYVVIDFSIDGIEEKAKYIRHPSSWDKVSSNFKTISDLTVGDPKIVLNVCFTISILSIYYLPDLLNYLKNLNFYNVFLNILHEPQWYNIKNIPDGIKEKIKDSIGESLKEVISGFPNNDSFMNILNEECDIKQWDKFLKLTKYLDETRGESFSETFPEYAAIIKSEGYDI